MNVLLVEYIISFTNREVHHIAILAYRFHNDKIYTDGLIYPWVALMVNCIKTKLNGSLAFNFCAIFLKFRNDIAYR